MNIGIVTTWFERGAAIVSKQFEEYLSSEHSVYVFARGEEYAEGNPKWDTENVYWSKKRTSPLSYYINEAEFKNWVRSKKLDIVLFNEQRYWPPIYWCAELGVRTMAYVDYYTKENVDLFNMYDAVVCNTSKHMSAMKTIKNSSYIPWGTNVNLYSNYSTKLVNESYVTFFHSAGFNPYRKGTDFLINAFYNIHDEVDAKLIIHSQADLKRIFPELSNIVEILIEREKLEVITETVPAPGLYHLGDVYVYPSRLDGLGLTVAEALSSGLGLLVTNEGPMNEFLTSDTGLSIDVEKFKERSDGYYWPESYVNLQDLERKLVLLSNNKQQVICFKKQARLYACKKLDWTENVKSINSIINNVLNTEIDLVFKNKFIDKAIALDNQRYPYIHKCHFVYSAAKLIKNAIRKK
ncbi:glycosyltransferase family 4 protein [Vibrio fluvialis]|nr:glycosyltransferase family 4 protein [Vibrio fluvialis]